MQPAPTADDGQPLDAVVPDPYCLVCFTPHLHCLSRRQEAMA